MRTRQQDSRQTYLVTVTTTHYVEVVARDEEHARSTVQRRLASDYGPRRFPEITDIEVVL